MTENPNPMKKGWILPGNFKSVKLLCVNPIISQPAVTIKEIIMEIRVYSRESFRKGMKMEISGSNKLGINNVPIRYQIFTTDGTSVKSNTENRMETINPN
jgi:hypothetical protein